jgi:integrase
MGSAVADPSDLVDPPKPARRVLTTWTADQLRTFLAGVTEDRLAVLWQLAAASGMRIGEWVALEWPDVHLDGQHLTVRRSMTPTAGGRQRSGWPSASATATTAGSSPARAASR